MSTRAKTRTLPVSGGGVIKRTVLPGKIQCALGISAMLYDQTFGQYQALPRYFAEMSQSVSPFTTVWVGIG